MSKKKKGRPRAYGNNPCTQSIRMPKDLFDSLKKVAKEKGVSFNALSVEILKSWTGGYEGDHALAHKLKRKVERIKDICDE